ncbi:Bgt-50040 [Blumeria graminis f. sp. tritici]|uniref:Bgt-50040 n=1 Tax=Blumeria graminis f. sp. tritici TaxID=62690 RepID=A0A9X9MG04_BLUGR|nr:Bgt-50040 [Blumeria graminis f. sp. tritici]
MLGHQITIFLLRIVRKLLIIHSLERLPSLPKFRLSIKLMSSLHMFNRDEHRPILCVSQ